MHVVMRASAGSGAGPAPGAVARVHSYHLGPRVFRSERSVARYELGQRLRRQRLREIRLAREPWWGPEDGTEVRAGAPDGPAVARPGAGPVRDDWPDRAWHALVNSDYHTAAYEAVMARHRYGDTPQAWSVLARASAGLGRLEDAVAQAHRAVRLEPHGAGHHLILASVTEELGDWDAALQCYRDAERLAPGWYVPLLGTAAVLAHLGDTERALVILERAHFWSPDRPVVGDHLGLALAEAAERVPLVREREAYALTCEGQIALMRTLLRRAAEMARDPGLQAEVAGIRRHVDRCARRELLTSALLCSRSRQVDAASAVTVPPAVPLADRVPVPSLLLTAFAAVRNVVGLGGW
ncbi:MAG TPA: hypothetical protein VFM55_03060 [Micromonosporaceae bacterium]|nr:hypothetical protein [Micromonosporaceae bacterium]